jgi:outer membrane protein OmpU
MKNILMATTALVATAGIASADIANFGISGFAEMGMVGGNGTETQFHQDIDVSFSGSGETDGGLEFGATIDLDETHAPTDVTVHQGTSVFVSGGFGNLTMGDTDGAMDWALTEGGNVGSPGSIADNETTHGGYLGSYLDGHEDGQMLRYDNTIGSFGVAASIVLDDDGATDIDTVAEALAAGAVGVRNSFTAAGAAVATATTATTSIAADNTDSGDASMALGVRYSMDMSGDTLTVGAGYQSAADRVVYIATATDTAADAINASTMASAETTATGFSATYAMASGLSIGVAMTQYGDYAGVNATPTADGTANAATAGFLTDASHLAIGVGYATGQLTVHANYGELDYDSVAITDVDGYGVAVGYDLGGASVLLGMNNNDAGADWSLGLSMSF